MLYLNTRLLGKQGLESYGQRFLLYNSGFSQNGDNTAKLLNLLIKLGVIYLICDPTY